MFRNILIILLYVFSIYLILVINLVQSLENIASNKPADQSSSYSPIYEASKAVDGMLLTFAHGKEEPNTLNWWKVDLSSEHYISQVLLTPRQDYNEAGRMDYVYIGISNSPDISGEVKYPIYPLCRQSPYKVIKVNYKFQNMSISCRPNTPSGRYVVVQQPTTSPGFLTISEIEVYGIKLENSTCQGNYYGDKCDKYCNCDKGVKCDQQGICPNGCDVNWQGEHCDKRTFNDSQLIGCFDFRDSSNYEFRRMNSQSCIVTCSGYGFTFAANTTIKNDLCLCTDTMNWATIKNEGCLANCSPLSCQNFYAVCPNGTYGYNCTLKCNCLNNGRCSYMEGRCEDGCANGWTGDSCNIRVCPTGSYGYDCTFKCNCLNNGNCSHMEGRCENGCANGWTGGSCYVRNCTTYNGGCDENETCISNSSDISSCPCKEGFNRSNITLPCQQLPVSENTTNNPSDVGNPPNASNKSAIIGGVIGSIAGLCLIVALIIFLVKRKNRLGTTESTSSLSKKIHTQKENISLNGSPPSERKLKFQEFPEHLDKNRTNVVDEFQNLNRSEETHLNYSKEQALKLNRFKNIIPYQHNRVKLIRKPNENQSDYINASYIEGIVEGVLIAAQGPVKNSVQDFWEMIWQQDIGIIIMLCNYAEHKKVKCEQYFPEANNFKAGKYTIHHHKTILWPSFRMTESQVSNMNGNQRPLIHLHFTDWPDHGVPSNVFYLLDFFRRCQQWHKIKRCGILVHCSAGVGRTGSFLAIYDLLVKGYEGLDLSVPETVNNLRKQRMKMVEKQVQYNFIYEALAEEVKMGPTSFSKNKFTKFYNDSKDGGTKRSHLLYQHEILSNFHLKNENRDESITFIKVITSEFNFCLLPHRSPFTWTNIADSLCIIMFDPKNENSFIPKVYHPIIDGQVSVSLVNERNSEWGKVFEVQKKGDNESNYENVVMNPYENTNASSEKFIKMCLVDKKEGYLDFLTFMEMFSELPNDANIAIISGNNQTLGYFFMAACNIISQLKVYDEVAIFQNLCELCKITDYQPSQVCFEKLHQIVHEFILTSG